MGHSDFRNHCYGSERPIAGLRARLPEGFRSLVSLRGISKSQPHRKSSPIERVAPAVGVQLFGSYPRRLQTIPNFGSLKSETFSRYLGIRPDQSHKLQRLCIGARLADHGEGSAACGDLPAGFGHMACSSAFVASLLRPAIPAKESRQTVGKFGTVSPVNF